MHMQRTWITSNEIEANGQHHHVHICGEGWDYVHRRLEFRATVCCDYRQHMYNCPALKAAFVWEYLCVGRPLSQCR